MKLSNARRRVLGVLINNRGLLTCAEVGEIMWGRTSRKPQAYARPAGALLRSMWRDGLVRFVTDDRGRDLYTWTAKGRRAEERGHG